MQSQEQEALLQEVAALKQRVAELESTQSEYESIQKEIEEAGKQNSSLFELAGESIFIIEPESRQIVDANENAARRLGYTRDELVGLNMGDIEVLFEEETQSRPQWESLYSRTKFYECDHLRQDGSRMPVAVSSRLAKRGGRAVLINFVRDITLRREMEREREQLIQELNAYAHTVAHDLKNPIQILMGYSEVLLEGLQEIPEDQVRHFLSIINSTSHKMRSIIDELLLLAGVRNLTEVKIAPIDMAVVTQGALDRLQKAISDADAVLTLPDRWPVAYGYAPWIEEVWSNYISNAIKYGGEPPHIELGATLLEGDMVQFWVRDYGPGIAAENLHHLFDQFTRLDGTRAEGHGLGLSIVKRIMDKLNGDVGVESTPGTGSVFSFVLPQHPVAEES